MGADRAMLCMNKDRDVISTIAKTNQPINNNREDFEGEETRESILCLMLRRTGQFSDTGQYVVIIQKFRGSGDGSWSRALAALA